MQNSQYTLSHLFAQLGLPAEAQQIEDFITARRPLANGVALYRAPFWSPAQRAFLKEEIGKVQKETSAVASTATASDAPDQQSGVSDNG